MWELRGCGRDDLQALTKAFPVAITSSHRADTAFVAYRAHAGHGLMAYRF